MWFSGIDYINEWSFGGPDKKCSGEVPDTYLGSLGSDMDFPKRHNIIDKVLS